MAIELWLHRQQKKSGGVLYPFLKLASSLYEIGITVRHWFYDKGFLTSNQSGRCVVSVGNITAGGSGKTPVVAYITSILEAKCKVAILSRGYRGQAEEASAPVCARDKEGELLSWEVCGDEPYYLAKRFAQAVVIVGRERKKSAQLACRRGCDVLVLDDGMQHRRLNRDIEIIVIEGEDPFGGGHFLPLGRLREDPRRIAKADLLVINGVLSLENRERLSSLTKAPLVVGEMVVTEVIDQTGNRLELYGKRVAIFCALGRPDRFVKQMQALFDIDLGPTFFLPDHRPFTKEQLLAFAKKADEQGAYYLCCTEKDWVKLPKIKELKERLVCIKAEFVVKENQEGFNGVMKRIMPK